MRCLRNGLGCSQCAVPIRFVPHAQDIVQMGNQRSTEHIQHFMDGNKKMLRIFQWACFL